jgi:hypothetical protein
MRVIGFDGFHNGYVIDLPGPSPTIKLIKPRTVTFCDWDDPSVERFEFNETEIAHQLAFASVDGKIALYSERGDSQTIFNSGFDYVWRQRPWHKKKVLFFGRHDYNVWK